MSSRRFQQFAVECTKTSTIFSLSIKNFVYYYIKQSNLVTSPHIISPTSLLDTSCNRMLLLIMTCLNCNQYLAILATSWLHSVCQLQRLSVTVSVGATEHVISLSVGHWSNVRLPLPQPMVPVPLPFTIPHLKSYCQQRLWDVNSL